MFQNYSRQFIHFKAISYWERRPEKLQLNEKTRFKWFYTYSILTMTVKNIFFRYVLNNKTFLTAKLYHDGESRKQLSLTNSYVCQTNMFKWASIGILQIAQKVISLLHNVEFFFSLVISLQLISYILSYINRLSCVAVI